MIRSTKFALFACLLAAAAMLPRPASAQFFDQSTWLGGGAGSANSQTVLVPNATSYADVLGVLLKFQPSVSNTSAATLAISGISGGPFPVKKANGAGLASLVGGEIVSGTPTVVMFDGNEFVLVSPVLLPVTSAYIQSSALGFSMPPNLSISATVASNQLTIALKTTSGADATASNPVLFPFRDATIGLGDPVWVSLASAASFTISSGNTMGCQSAVMCRLWVVALNNGGNVQVCAFNALSGTNVAAINEAGLVTSQVGSGGGNSAQLYYCNNAVSLVAKPIRIIGYVDIQETVAGTWSTAPTLVQLMGPGIKKPGDRIQGPLYSQTTASTTSTGATPTATALTTSIAPTSAANLVRVHVTATLSNTSTGNGYAEILRNGATQVGSLGVVLPSMVLPAPVEAMDQPNTTGSTSYTIYIFSSGTGNAVLNQGLTGATGVSTITLEEIMSALEPANDDVPAASRSMVG